MDAEPEAKPIEEGSLGAAIGLFRRTFEILYEAIDDHTSRTKSVPRQHIQVIVNELLEANLVAS